VRALQSNVAELNDETGLREGGRGSLKQVERFRCVTSPSSNDRPIVARFRRLGRQANPLKALDRVLGNLIGAVEVIEVEITLDEIERGLGSIGVYTFAIQAGEGIGEQLQRAGEVPLGSEHVGKVAILAELRQAVAVSGEHGTSSLVQGQGGATVAAPS
jgi:hypothetical protein